MALHLQKGFFNSAQSTVFIAQQPLSPSAAVNRLTGLSFPQTGGTHALLVGLHIHKVGVLTVDQDFAARLRDILQEHEQRLAEEQKRRAEEEARARAFRERFEAVRQNVLLPVLEETRTLLEQHGHRSTLTGTEAGEPELCLWVYPAPFPAAVFREDSTPYIRFLAHPTVEQVTVDLGISLPSRPQAIGPRETVDLSALTVEYVRAKVLEWLTEILLSDPAQRSPRRSGRRLWSASWRRVPGGG